LIGENCPVALLFEVDCDRVRRKDSLRRLSITLNPKQSIEAFGSFA